MCDHAYADVERRARSKIEAHGNIFYSVEDFLSFLDMLDARGAAPTHSEL